MNLESIKRKALLTLHFVIQTKFLQTLAYCGAFLCLGLLLAGLGPSLPTIGRNTNTTDATMGGAVTARALGYMLGSTTGPLFHKLPGNQMIASSLIFTSAVCFVLPHLKNFYILAALFVGQGISMGLLDTGCNLMVLWLHQQNCDPYIQALHASFAVGAVISPLILQSFISHKISISIAWYLFGAAFVPVIIALFYYVSPKEPSQEESPTHNFSWRVDFKPHLMVLGTAVFLGFYVGGEVATGSFLTVFAYRRHLSTEAGGAFLTFIFWLTFAFGRLIAIPLSIFVSSKLMMIIDLLGTFVSILFIWTFVNNYTGIAISLCAYGFFMASTFPTAFSLLQSVIPVTGNMATIFVIGASTGEMLVPLIVSNNFEATNYMSLIYMQFASTIGGIVIMIGVAILGYHLLQQRAKEAAALELADVDNSSNPSSGVSSPMSELSPPSSSPTSPMISSHHHHHKSEEPTGDQEMVKLDL